MRTKSVVLLILALGCGLVASIGISQVMDRSGSGSGAPAVETEEIYVANTNINGGDSLNADMLKLEAWPKDKIPVDAMRVLEEIEGRKPRMTIFKDEPIRENKLLKAGDDTASNTIPAGFRPFPIRVSAVSSAAGLIKPHDRVDIQLYMKRNSSLNIESTTVKTILQNIRVFAVDQHYRRSADNNEASVVARTISVLVTPEQTEQLSLATEVGTLRLILRNPDDEDIVRLDGADISEVINQEESNSRQKERSTASSGKPQTGFTQFLQNMNNSAPPQPTTQKQWEIVVIEGSDAREFVVPEDGKLPHERGAAVPAVQPQLPAPPAQTPQPAAAEPQAGQSEPAQAAEPAGGFDFSATGEPRE